MWSIENIISFFSLFGLTKESLDLLGNNKLQKLDLDKIQLKDLQQLINIDESTAYIILMMWKNYCTFRYSALDGIHETKKILTIWSQFITKSSISITNNNDFNDNDKCFICTKINVSDNSNNNDSDNKVSPHYINLKNIIEEQKERIDLLQLRENDLQDELKKREQLILDLQNQLILLQESYDHQFEELKVFKNLADDANLILYEETENLRNSLEETVKSVKTLEEIWLKESSSIIDKLEKDYFKPIQFNTKENSDNLPAIEFFKITCDKLPFVSSDTLNSSMNPYLVLSLKDAIIQTNSLPGVLSGNQVEWISSNESSNYKIESFFTINDLLSVELWNQYAIHESHLIAKANYEFITSSLIESWKLGKDYEDSITFQLHHTNETNNVNDNQINLIDTNITLYYRLKSNLYNHVEIPSNTNNNTITENIYNKENDNNSDEKNHNDIIDSYIKSREIKLNSNLPENKSEFEPFIESWRSLMKSLILTKLNSNNTSKFSNLLFNTQQTLSQSLSNSINVCRDQFAGMREYAISLQLLMERLRTEKSYIDILKETESRYEQSITLLQNNYIELDNMWKIKYQELEYTSKLKYDQYVQESEAKYTNLLETTTLAYSELKAAYDKSRLEIASLSEQLAESFSRYEKLKLNYEEVCRRLDAEIQALATTNLKLKEVENELEETIEIVRKDMAQRCISKNAAEDLLTLSSQLISRDHHNTNNSVDFLNQFDWNALYISLNVNMTENDIDQIKSILIQIKNSYDILCSRLFLECRARVEIEKILNNTKDDLEGIKNQIISEVKIRKKLEEELKFAKELAANEAKFASVAKKTAEDAIKQARYFQRKLNREIDQINDNITGTDVIGEISLSLPNYGSETPEDDTMIPRNNNGNNNNKNSNNNNNKSKRPKSAESRGVSSLEDNFYANLALTPESKPQKKNKDNDSISTGIKSKGIFEMDDSPYIQHLSPRSKKLIRRGEFHSYKDNSNDNSRNGSINSTPIYGKHYSDGLQTSSESGVDSKKRKDKRIPILSKKFIKNVVKKSFSGKSKSQSTVAPYSGDESTTNYQIKGEKQEWIDPNTKDYSKKSLRTL